MIEIELQRGVLSLQPNDNSHWKWQDLLGFAERINPKRAFLFVSKVLGRHIPVSPSIMRHAFTDLAELVPDDLPEPVLVIGMAETAVGLGAGVHQVLQQRYPEAIYVTTTRHPVHGAPLPARGRDGREIPDDGQCARTDQRLRHPPHVAQHDVARRCARQGVGCLERGQSAVARSDAAFYAPARRADGLHARHVRHSL